VLAEAYRLHGIKVRESSWRSSAAPERRADSIRGRCRLDHDLEVGLYIGIVGRKPREQGVFGETRSRPFRSCRGRDDIFGSTCAKLLATHQRGGPSIWSFHDYSHHGNDFTIGFLIERTNCFLLRLLFDNSYLPRVGRLACLQPRGKQLLASTTRP
jgi:hypothetical protein